MKQSKKNKMTQVELTKTHDESQADIDSFKGPQAIKGSGPLSCEIINSPNIAYYCMKKKVQYLSQILSPFVGFPHAFWQKRLRLDVSTSLKL